MKIQYNGSSKILKRLVELVNRSQNVALRQDSTDKNTLYWTGLDGVEITVNIPSGAVKVDTELSETSTNPVENQAITKELAQKADKSVIPTVGDGVLSLQRNGKSVGTFSANAAENEAINIPVPEKVSELENDAGYGTYTKPTTGIPKSDLASGVQASLGKADTALQKHQDISGKLDKTGDASTTTVAFSAASARENVKTGEKLSVIVGKIAKWFADLKTVAFTGSYTDLANKPTIPDGSKYLPLAGGKMTGDIDMQTNKRDILVGTHKANTSDGTAVAGGIIEKRANMTSTLPEMRSFVGMFHNTDIDRFYNLISVRHRNGYSDGNLYGMYIFSESTTASADLKWGKQTKASGWTNDFTLLDSRNYTNYALTKDGTAVKANALSAGHMKYGYVQNSTTTAGSGYTWARVAYCEDTVGYDTITMTLLATSGHNGAGLFSVSYRNGSTGKACDWIRFEQIFTNKPTGLANAYFKFVAVYTDSGVRYEIWHNTQVRWNSTQFTCLAEQAYAGANTNRWIFEKHDATTFQTAPPTGNKEATYYNNGVVNTATTLTDSGWVAMTVEGYAKSGTVKYRTYGKQITITGSVVLKNDIATSYPAPQYIASTTFDFSKIVGCSGVGRSSSGVGAYVVVENYNGDNLVCVYALGSKIAAGATLYFTITGFID